MPLGTSQITIDGLGILVAAAVAVMGWMLTMFILLSKRVYEHERRISEGKDPEQKILEYLTDDIKNLRAEVKELRDVLEQYKERNHELSKDLAVHIREFKTNERQTQALCKELRERERENLAQLVANGLLEQDRVSAIHAKASNHPDQSTVCYKGSYEI